jgi:hypothetical protein
MFTRRLAQWLITLGLVGLSAPLMAAVDEAQNALLSAGQGRWFFDPQPPISLAAGESTRVRIPPAGLVRIELGSGDAKPNFWQGAGRGLEQRVVATMIESGIYLLRGEWLGESWLTIDYPVDAGPALELAVFVSRREAPPMPVDYRQEQVAHGGIAVRLGASAGAGSEPAVRLAAGATWVLRLTGPARLQVRQRAQLNEATMQDLLTWEMNAEVDGLARTWHLAGRLDTTPPRLDGTPIALTSERESLLEIPAGEHRVSLSASEDIVMRVNRLAPRDERIVRRLLEQDDERSVVDATGSLDPFDADVDTITARLTEPQRGDAEVAAAAARVSLDPLFDDGIVAVTRHILAAVPSSSAPDNLLDEAALLDATRGRWVGLPQVEADSAELALLTWTETQPQALLATEEPLLPRSSLAALAAGLPQSQFVKTSRREYTRLVQAQAGRLRLVTLAGQQWRVQLLSGQTVVEERLLRSVKPDSSQQSTTAALALSALFNEVNDPLRLVGLVESAGGSAFTVAANVLEFEVAKDITSVVIESPEPSWVALEERLRRPLAPRAESLAQLGQAMGGTQVALARLGAVSSPQATTSTLRQFDAMTAGLKGWLDAQTRLFADGLAPRPPRVVDSPQFQPEAVVPLTAGADPLTRLQQGAQLLDHTQQPKLRSEALDAMLTSLDASNEHFLAETLLRGSIMFESGFRARAAEALRERLHKADDFAGLVMLEAVLLRFTSDIAALERLIAALELADQPERAASFRALTGIAALPVPSPLPLPREDWLATWLEASRDGVWENAPQLISRAAGTRRLVNQFTGASLNTFLSTATEPLQVNGRLPAPLRVTLFPHHDESTANPRQLSGEIIARHNDGRVIRVVYDNNGANLTLVAPQGAQPGRSVTIDLPDAGPWTITPSLGTTDLQVSQWVPRHWPYSLPRPSLQNRALLDLAPLIETVADKPASWLSGIGLAQGSYIRLATNTGFVPDWTRIPPGISAGDLSVASRVGSSARDIPQPLELPPDFNANAMFTGTASLDQLVKATDAGTARERMRGILALARLPGSDPVQLYSEAITLEQAFADEPALVQQRLDLEKGSRWRAVSVVESSAGLTYIPHDAAEETGVFAATRAAMLGAPERAQRILRPDAPVVFRSTDTVPRSLSLRLDSVRPGFIAAVDATVRLEVDDQSQTLQLSAGESLSVPVMLPVGEHTVRVALLDSVANTWVAITLLENDEPLPWVINQRYHAATLEEPIVMFLEGPGLLRVINADRPQPEYHVLAPGPQRLTLTSPTDAPSYFRLHLREALPVAALQDSEIDPRGVQRAAPATSIGVPAASLQDWPAIGAGLDAVAATWSAGVELLARQELDDVVTGRTEDRFVGVNITRRHVDRQENDWDLSRLEVRERQRGEPVLGLSHRREHRFARWGMSSMISAAGYLQAGEFALTGRASLVQRRVLGPRSSHTPSVSAVVRSLTLDGVDPLAANAIDLDVYSRYKSDHPLGVELGDEWQYSPWLDTRITAGATLLTNSNGSIDRVGLTAAVDHLFGPIAARAQYQVRQFQADSDRTQASTAQRLSLDFEWRRFDLAWRHWQLGSNITYDLDSRSLNLALSVDYNFGRGRGLRDFSPTSVRFRPLRQLSAPYFAETASP